MQARRCGDSGHRFAPRRTGNMVGRIVREPAGAPDAWEGRMKILLPVDGSEFSNAAVQELVRRPWPEGTQVEVLSVAQPMPELLDPKMIASAVHAESLARAMQRARFSVDDAMATITHSAPMLAVTTKVVEGSAKDAIVEEATNWGADLILMGSHGYRAAMRFLLGSVSHAVALHAPCSVEIVRTRGSVEKSSS